MKDLIHPEAHTDWCQDRLKPRSEDHATTNGVQYCATEVGSLGGLDVILTESADGLKVYVGCETFRLDDAIPLFAGLDAAMIAVGAVA